MDEVSFGRYRLVSVIGEGGMGTVYKAHDTVIGRDVAIKVLTAELADEPGYRERFRREAFTAARLSEPHIIPIFDTGEFDSQLYLVMPIIQGTDVGALLRREGPLRPDRAVRVVEQLAAALDAAHAVGLVHRDIKPSNTLVTGNDFVYLIDFGIAHDKSATKLTNTGMIVGTMAYMAPERFTSGASDARSDVYALACVLHECLTGGQPYPGSSMEQQIAGHLTQDPPRPTALRQDLPGGFDNVIASGMAKDPAQRYQTANQLATAAHQALTSAPARTRRPTPVQTVDTRTTPITARSQFGGQGPPAHARGHQQPPPYQPPAAAEQNSTSWPPVPQQPPSIWTPPVSNQPEPPPKKSGLRSGQIVALVAVFVTAVVVVVAVVAFQLTQRNSTENPAAATSSQPAVAPSARSTTPTLSTPRVAPLTSSALDGIMLDAAAINTAMGASGMVLAGSSSVLYDNTAIIADKACLPISAEAETNAYTGTGWQAVRGQKFWEAGDTHPHIANQFLVLFASAQEAQAFFTSSAQNWPACANRQYDVVRAGDHNQTWTVGPVSNSEGILSATRTLVPYTVGTVQNHGSCGRALTVANNVAIDIEACSIAGGDGAVNIARRIAAKVPS